MTYDFCEAHIQERSDEELRMRLTLPGSERLKERIRAEIERRKNPPPEEEQLDETG